MLCSSFRFSVRYMLNMSDVRWRVSSAVRVADDVLHAAYEIHCAARAAFRAAEREYDRVREERRIGVSVSRAAWVLMGARYLRAVRRDNAAQMGLSHAVHTLNEAQRMETICYVTRDGYSSAGRCQWRCDRPYRRWCLSEGCGGIAGYVGDGECDGLFWDLLSEMLSEIEREEREENDAAALESTATRGERRAARRYKSARNSLWWSTRKGRTLHHPATY